MILYEMITGQLPFKGDYDQAVIYGIVNEQPKPITGLRTGVPPELERIINRCISKDPQDRYRHANDLLSELNRLKKDSESGITLTQTVAIKKPSKTILILTAILLILILIIAGYLLMLADKTSSTEWENSIAVLPFDNISNDPDQDYFCDGMTEQIITNLSKLGRLKVIARTSVMTYKNSNKQIPEIGKELSVTHILEGSVRKYRNSIRVTAQLINTIDGSHLWAEDFDRELKHVFDVQDDVSQAIATNLLATLSPQEKIAMKANRPANTEAYEYYLKAKYLHYLKTFEGTSCKKFLKQSEEMFQKAIEHDPNYADAYAGLADVYNTYYNHFADTDEERKNNIHLQEEYLKTAFKLDSLSAEAHYVNNFLHQDKAKIYYMADDYEKFEYELNEQVKSLKKALEINKNHSDAYHMLGWFYQTRGLNNLSIKYWSKSFEINPLYYYRYKFRGRQYMKIGDFSKAEADLQKVLDFKSDDLGTLFSLSQIRIAQKRYDEADKILFQIEDKFPDKNTNWERALLYASKGQRKKVLDIYKNKSMSVYALLGMKDEAISIGTKWSEGRLKQKRSEFYFLKTNPIYDNIRSDPRFQEILAKQKELYEENLHKYGDIEEY